MKLNEPNKITKSKMFNFFKFFVINKTNEYNSNTNNKDCLFLLFDSGDQQEILLCLIKKILLSKDSKLFIIDKTNTNVFLKF